MHSILSLKMDVTNWYQSLVDCMTQALLEMVVVASFYSLILCLLSCFCYLINFYASYVLFYYETFASILIKF
jgi:hypothetical protein